ncbi:uroporphyrinogen-III C-methyltransferase [Nitrincola tapanii]|uniref:uroporphyrinogen-III C-methyltransferase n=1 Tax=Nitrincola tapanii TaxID=1708751 RepID=A0A5A9W8P2_9GAMM|nr:uroporphyrinogen-III C-methyltransferase [Nitrincola tapanii]KAA0876369.1 uroporphyrinogen-III C-methyltransferase [Nitrincola tapanii]
MLNLLRRPDVYREGWPKSAFNRLTQLHTPQTTDTSTKPGQVALIGAGPGDPELITRKAWRLIQSADVLLYDALVSEALMQEIPPHIRRIYVGKQKGAHSMSQEAIGKTLVGLAQQGLQVVRLKGGDALIFGRLGEELDALKAAGIPYQIVPGITAAAGCAASAGFALTERGQASRLRLITAHHCDGRSLPWADLAQTDETLVFYMGLSQAHEISRGLREAGLPDDWPVLLVERGTQANERRVKTDLLDLPQAIIRHQLESPTLIFVGQVVQQVESEQAHALGVHKLWPF